MCTVLSMPMLDDPTTRGRAAHLGPERRRPQVLDAALAIVVEQGIGAVTIGAIAQRLKVTRPVVYACYADRVEIIEALLDRETTHLHAALLDSLHSARGDDPQAAFVDGYQSLLGVVASRPDSWRLVFSAAPDPAVVDRFVQVRADMSRSAASWIGPVLSTWWAIDDVDTKLPVLIELFLSSCEAAVRSLLDTSNSWNANDLGALYGRIMASALSVA